jgi:hypothetical protein
MNYQRELFGRDWKSERDEGMDRVSAKADRIDATFTDRAKAFVVHYLTIHLEESGEVIVSAAKDAGIIPHDDRAFGGVFLALVNRGIIYRVGMVKRKKGHGAPGAQIWRLRR